MLLYYLVVYKIDIKTPPKILCVETNILSGAIKTNNSDVPSCPSALPSTPEEPLDPEEPDVST